MQLHIKNKQPNITDFPELLSVPEPKEKLPSIKVNGVANVSSKELDNGIAVKIK
mgnify:CR=1 FL=1